MIDAGLELRPGTAIRLRVPKPCFYPEGHPLRTTAHGPLVPRNSTLHYLGPCPGRPGVHLAQTAPLVQDQQMEVFFGVEDLVDG
jgi:hypothetical protein